MKTWLAVVLAAGVVAVPLFGVSSASAATEFGDNCVANQAEGEPSITIFELGSPGNSLPAAAPVSGVITKWRVNLVPEVPFAIPTSLELLRVDTGAKTATKVGEASGSVAAGGSTFEARIPVQAGDRLGIFGSSEVGTLFCQVEGGPEGPIGAFAGSGGAVGASTPYEEINAPARVPIVAFIEPDADNDGFGDETQDQCPQNAAVQAACPLPVTLSTFKQIKKGSVTVVVTPSAASTVTVKGVASLGKGKKATLRGGTQILAPGLQGKFKLFFTKPLKTKLKELSPNKKLTLKVTVAGTNVVGPETLKTLKVKLKGQAKPEKKDLKKKK